ncbi:MAG: glycosyltransferase, partial [Actinobacteria bacterium]|nr:glycosyltransferase [Actinomycetota bacterium]
YSTGTASAWVSRTGARRQLGLREGETVFLMFGAIKPYKGLTESIDAINELALEGPVRLVVAGKADESAETDAFIKSALTNPVVIVRPELIDPKDVQVYFRAADIALLPYRRTLNSGALALALTFGLPVIMPSDSGSLPLLAPEFSEVFDSGDGSSLLAAMRRASRLVNAQARAAASAAAQAVHLSKVADDFGRAAQDWISRRTR